MIALASLWTWLAIGLVVIVGFCVDLVVALVTLPFDRRRVVVGRVFRFMGELAARLNPLWSFRVAGPAPRRIAGRTVVVSNHASQADIMLICLLRWEMKWLSKEVLFRVPFLGWCMWLAGDVPVRRGDRESGGHALAECATWLARDVPVMIFPEGTRSKDGQLKAFKDGAFRLALDAGADILPLAVHGTRTALPKASWRFGRARARVMVGTPIASAGRSVDELKALALSQISAMLAQLVASERADRGVPSANSLDAPGRGG